MLNIFKSKKQKLIIKIKEQSQKLIDKMSVNKLYKSSTILKRIYDEYVLPLVDELDVESCKTLYAILEDITPLCVPMHENLIIDKLREIDKLFVGTYKKSKNASEIDDTKVQISRLENEIRELEKERNQISSKKAKAVKESDKISFGFCLRELQKIESEITFKTKSLDTLYKSLTMLNTSEYLHENSDVLRQAEINAGVANADEMEVHINQSNEIINTVDEDYVRTNELVGNASFDNDLDAEWQKAQADMLVDEEIEEESKNTTKLNK